MSTSTKTQITLLFLNQMLKVVHVILWDQITAQIFPVHRVLCVSMAALPMNLNAKTRTGNCGDKSAVKIKVGRKTTQEKRKKIFLKTSEPFLCNLGINGFHFESYGPYKKSSPSQQCKNKQKKSFFFVFLNSLLYEGLFRQNKIEIFRPK